MSQQYTPSLISPNAESTFRAEFSICESPLTHNVCKSFKEVCEVTEVFLEISTAIDKIWYLGCTNILQENGTPANPMKIWAGFLNICKKWSLFLLKWYEHRDPTWLNSGTITISNIYSLLVRNLALNAK